VRGRGLPALLAAALVVLAGPASVAAAPTERTTKCPTAPWNELEVAHEIIDIGTVYTRPKEPLATYKGAGENPVPDDVWNAGYAPPNPYIANTTRNLQFNESQFIASPGEPICSTAYIATADGYTWAAMSMAVNALWPYDGDEYRGLPARNPFYAGNLVETPPDGVVKVTANFKAQRMKFWANEDGAAPGTPGAVPLPRYFVRDRWGNEYVMHASGGETPQQVRRAFRDAVLPAGWRKIERPLDSDLVLDPAEGSDGSFHYLVIRDSADNTYHQYKWSKRGALQAQVEGTGMPIWGSEGDDVLRGQPGSDLIHGGGGDDRIRPRWGQDEIWGDAGFDTVILRGDADRYRLIRLADDRERLVIHGFGARKKLRSVERLEFKDRRINVRSLRAKDVGKRL
jgi:hypothetical protein